MRNFSKILCALLVLAVLMTALVFAVSADEVNEVEYKKPDGTVDTSVTTYVAAVAAVNTNGGGTITLKKDVAITGTLPAVTLYKSCTLDLGEYTLDFSGADLSVTSGGNTTSKHPFIPQANTKTVVKGTGEIKISDASLIMTGSLSNGTMDFVGEADDHLTITAIGSSVGSTNTLDQRYGTVTFENVDFTVTDYGAWIANVSGGKLIFKDSTLNVNIADTAALKTDPLISAVHNASRNTTGAIELIGTTVNVNNTRIKNSTGAETKDVGVFRSASDATINFVDSVFNCNDAQILVNVQNQSVVTLDGVTVNRNAGGHGFLLAASAKVSAVDSVFTSANGTSANHSMFNCQGASALEFVDCEITVNDKIRVFNLFSHLGGTVDLYRSTVKRTTPGALFQVDKDSNRYSNTNVNAYNCTLSAETLETRGTVSILSGGGMVLREDVDGKEGTPVADPFKLNCVKCDISCFGIGYKNSLAFAFDGYCVDLDFTDCSISTNWRMFVGLRGTEGAKVKLTTVTGGSSAVTYPGVKNYSIYSTIDLVRCVSNSYKLNVGVVQSGDTTADVKVTVGSTEYYKYNAKKGSASVVLCATKRSGATQYWVYTAESMKTIADSTKYEGIKLDSNTKQKLCGKEYYKYTATLDSKEVTIYALENANAKTYYEYVPHYVTEIADADLASYTGISLQRNVGNDHQFLRGSVTTNITDSKISLDGGGFSDSADSTLHFHGTNWLDVHPAAATYKGLTKYDSTQGEYSVILSDQATNPGAKAADKDLFLPLDSYHAYSTVAGAGKDKNYATSYLSGNVNISTVIRKGQFLIGKTWGSNRYATFSAGGATSHENDSYWEFGGGDLFEKVQYYAVEFDLFTDTTYIDHFSFYLNARNSKGSADGNNPSRVYLEVDDDGAYLLAPGNQIRYDLPDTAGSWVHITYLVSVTKNADGSFGGAFTVYVDGNRFYTATWLNAVADRFGGVRFHMPTNNTIDPDSTICLDNLSYKHFARTDSAYASAGAVIGEVAASAPVTLPEDPVFRYNASYEYPQSVLNAYIEGDTPAEDKFYGVAEDAFEDAVEGDTVVLMNDVKDVVDVDKAITVNTKGYELSTKSSTHYRTESGELYVFALYTRADDQHLVVNFKDAEGNELLKSFTVILGNLYSDAGVETLKPYFKNGNVYSHLGWADTIGGAAVSGEFLADEAGETSFYVVEGIAAENVKFYGEVSDDNDFWGYTWAELAEQSANLATGVTLNLTFYSDLQAEVSTKVTFPASSVVYFDLAGHQIFFPYKSDMIYLEAGSTFYLYSSVASGEIYAMNADNKGNTVVRINGNGVTANFGSFEGNSYGDNLYVNAACIVDSSYTATVNFNGGTYGKSVQDYKAYICDRGGALTVNMTDATFIMHTEGGGNAFLLPVSGKTVLNATDCVFYATTGAVMHQSDAGGKTATMTYDGCKFIGVIPNGYSAGTYVYTDCVASSNEFYKGTGYKSMLWDTPDQSVTVKFDANRDKELKEQVVGYNVKFKTVATNYTGTELKGNLVNLTLYSDFKINIYVPVDTAAAKISHTHGGEAVDLSAQPKVTIEGKEYYHFVQTMDATQASDYKRLYLVDENGYILLIKVSVADYAGRILNGEYADIEKQLMMTALNYAQEAEKLIGKAEDTTLAGILTNESYKGYITENTEYGTALDVSSIAAAVKSAQLNLDSQPDFIFTLDKTFAGTVTLSYNNFGGVTVSKEYVVEAGEADSVISLSTMKIHELWKTVTVKVVGTVGEDQVDLTGSYNLGTYVQGVAESEAGVALAKAIYSYSKMAATYREYVVANEGL